MRKGLTGCHLEQDFGRETHSHVFEGDGAPVLIIGFKRSKWKQMLVYTGYFLTFGILRLLFHWIPYWILLSTHSVCPLSQAENVLIVDSSGIRFTHNVSTSLLKLPRNLRPNRKKDEDNSGLSNTYDEKTEKLIFFIHKRLKYVWNSDKLHFELLSGWEERKYSEIFPVTPLSDEVVSYNRAIYGPNEIYLKLTPILVTLLSECLNPFYCFQIFSCALWLAEDYWTYASGILFISLISLITQVYEIRRNERALKETICGSALVTVCRETDGQIGFQQIDSTDLVPGDILEIPRNGCVMQCDALLLSGNCIVNESTLTGESVPVTKTPLPQRGDTKDEMFNLRAAARHVLFGGTSVIQTRNYADEKVLAVVARTSFRTAKGELVRAILFPKPLKFKFTQDAVKFVAALAVVALIGFCFSVYFMHRSGVETHMVIIRALDLITIAVPPALPMAMTIGIVFAQRRLRKQHIYCINPSVINVCGVINVTCFDKTGTLTEDGLDLWGVVPCTTGLFEEPQPEPAKLARGPLLECMATCHSLTRIGGVLSGDPLDLKMFQSTKWEFMEQVDEDYRKFAMAVLSVVRPMKENVSSGFTCLLDALPEKMPYEAGIVRQFSFTSSLQRMSVIARVLGGQQFHVYTKGAPETIEFLCRPDTVPSNFHSVLLEYTRAGYRVLALAWRPLKVTYARAIKIRRERVEQDLSFLGLLIMENRLKPETAAVIEALRDANVRPIMVTGDNMLTALSVARDCVMIDELDRIVIVSAQPPTDHSRQEAGNSGREASSCSSSPHNKPLGDVHTESDTPPLVQFHYAEDLHKPVTEVTMTKRTAGLRYSKHKTKSFMFRHWFKSLCPRFESRDEYRTTPMVHDSFKPLSSPNIPQTTGVHLTIEHEPTVEIENMTAASHRVDIRILDRSDFHLAISGKTWAVIRDHYPWLIPKLVVKGTVFARFSPDQKAQLIEALQSVGYFVAMCGDGANDCGALKAAHAGVSLSEAEASVASPFTTKQQNISCIPTLIREGRCALVTSFGILKFMIGYSLVQFFSVVLMYYIGSKVSNGEFLYIDLFLITTISITFGYTKAYEHLSPDPPSVHALSTVTILSLSSQLLVHVAVQLGAFISVRLQPWYLPLFRLGPEYRYANYETTVVFIVSVYQYISLAIVFARGAPYRRSIVTNYMFIVNLVICTIFTVYVTTYPCSWLLNSFEMVRLSSVGFLIVLHLVVLANFLLCYLLEWGINRMAFRRLLLSIRHNLCPQYRKFKAYEEIREELDKLAGSWPPLIRSASVHTLPRDLFADGDIPARSSPEEKFRHRNPSEMSTDSENDDVTEPCQVPTFQDDDALLSSIAEPLEDMATPLIHSDIFQTTALPPTLVDRERNSTDDQD